MIIKIAISKKSFEVVNNSKLKFGKIISKIGLTFKNKKVVIIINNKVII
jgi:hypothetical protein